MVKQAIIFGLGNIGSTLLKKITKDKINIRYIVKLDGVFDSNLKKISENKNWKNFIEDIDIGFICIPTMGEGEIALKYNLALLEKGKPIITCEKASLAYHWDLLKKYKDIFKYTASVGGGTKMLKEISLVGANKIVEIKGVVNGTLNYISASLRAGKNKEEIVEDILEKGYAEPGAKNFEEIIQGEMNDVILKTIIISNHSGLFNKITSKKDIEIIFPSDETLISKRCTVFINKEKIRCGFIENNNTVWLPDGVNNILYINGERKAFGPGAGAEATTEVMIEDLKFLFPK